MNNFDKDFEKNERSMKSAMKWGVGLWIAGAVVSLGMTGTIIYVIAHFVIKYWK